MNQLLPLRIFLSPFKIYNLFLQILIAIFHFPSIIRPFLQFTSHHMLVFIVNNHFQSLDCTEKWLWLRMVNPLVIAFGQTDGRDTILVAFRQQFGVSAMTWFTSDMQTNSGRPNSSERN